MRPAAYRSDRPLSSRLGQAGITLALLALIAAAALPLLDDAHQRRRAGAAAETAAGLAEALRTFRRHVGAFPTRDGNGRDGVLRVLFSGPATPPADTWTAPHDWVTWALDPGVGDRLDHHLIANRPHGDRLAAYASRGGRGWRGGYVPGPTPLDPWGRPFLVNVVADHFTHPTWHKRLWVISAGPNGRFDTSALATAASDVGGDDIAVLVQQQP